MKSAPKGSFRRQSLLLEGFRCSCGTHPGNCLRTILEHNMLRRISFAGVILLSLGCDKSGDHGPNGVPSATTATISLDSKVVGIISARCPKCSNLAKMMKCHNCKREAQFFKTESGWIDCANCKERLTGVTHSYLIWGEGATAARQFVPGGVLTYEDEAWANTPAPQSCGARISASLCNIVVK